MIAMYAYNPSPAEAALLALIEHRESGGSATAQNPSSSASGLYQFILGTWQSFGQLAGVDLTQYPTAKAAPAAVQSAVALLLLREVGPNSSESWQASGPYPTYQEAQLMLQAVGITT
jgi:resuscitation-promoting factor RpfA